MVAGKEGLGAKVRWVHVTELRDIAHLLSGGELLLTTGIALDSTPRALVAFVESLAAVGAAGVVVEAGRRFLEVPSPMVEAADRVRLPLVLLGREVRFVKVTEEAHSFIINSQTAELQARQEIHEAFTELAVEGASANDIIRHAAQMAKRPILLSSRGRQVLVCEPAGLDSASLIAQWRAVADDIPVSGRARFVPGTPGWLVTSVGARGETWALLALMTDDGEPTDRCRSILDRAAVGIALNRLVERDHETLELQAQRSFLTDLNSGSQTSAALQIRAEALGLRAEGHDLIAGYVRPREVGEFSSTLHSEAGGRDLGHRVSLAARGVGMNCLVGPLSSGHVVLLLALNRGSEAPPQLATLADAIHNSATANGEPDVVITFGSKVASLRDVRRSLAEAEQVLDSLRDPALRPYYQLPDIRVRGLLHLLRDDPRVEMFWERELGPLLGVDRRSHGALVAALRAFLEHSGNKASAAVALRLSRPTLYSRLAKVEQILNVDLNSADSRLSLQVALMAMDEARHSL